MKVLESTKERLIIGYKEDSNAFELVWLVLGIIAFGSVPFLGIGMLYLTVFAAVTTLVMKRQFPQKLFVFDKNKKLLIIKSKFWLWYSTTQYAFDEIVEAPLITKYFYVGSMTVRPMEFVRLTLKRRDGKILQEDMLYGAAANHDMAYKINKFLRH
jgi:hypothetical protein